MKLVSEAMRHDVVTVAPDDRAIDALAIAATAAADDLLVMDGEDLVGVVAIDDLAREGASGTVADHMRPVLLVVRPDAPVEEVAVAMATRQVRCAAVALGGLLLGTVSGASLAPSSSRERGGRPRRRGNMPHA